MRSTASSATSRSSAISCRAAKARGCSRRPITSQANWPNRRSTSIHGLRWRLGSCATSSPRTSTAQAMSCRQSRTAAATNSALFWPHDRVLLSSERELDDAVRVAVGFGDAIAIIRDRRIIETRSAALDQPPRLAVAGDQAGAPQQLIDRDAGGELGALDLQDWQVLAQAAFDEGTACRLCRIAGCS